MPMIATSPLFIACARGNTPATFDMSVFARAFSNARTRSTLRASTARKMGVLHAKSVTFGLALASRSRKAMSMLP